MMEEKSRYLASPRGMCQRDSRSQGVVDREMELEQRNNNRLKPILRKGSVMAEEPSLFLFEEPKDFQDRLVRGRLSLHIYSFLFLFNKRVSFPFLSLSHL